LSGDLTLLIAYFLVLLCLSVYGSHRYQMAWLYRRHKAEPPRPSAQPDSPPFVLVQLPMFNERFVAERLIDAACALEYPRDRLLIQVVDDSTDDSTEVARACVDRWAARGMPIEYRHRANRAGFKAGALQAGMEAAPQAELIAIFDADFIPPVDFLTRTVPYFGDVSPARGGAEGAVGVVQARWEHLNRERSLLTRAQAILLDGHFMIEHTARNRSGRFFNFNGTAGLWRRDCILDAGGWEHDTLTEDLDLSYRAQLRGWRFIYLNDVTAPAELPEDMAAFKAQQHRWAKGSIQVALKVLPRLLRADVPRHVKHEAVMHLTGNIAYVLMVLLSLLTPFTIELRTAHGWREAVLLDLPFFLSATASVAFFYGLSQREVSPGGWRARLWTLPAVMALGVGLAVNNTKATLEAFAGWQTPFVRTPKRGEARVSALARYRSPKALTSLVELALAAHFGYASWLCVREGLWLTLPFMILFLWGFLYVGLGSLAPGLLERLARRDNVNSAPARMG